MINSSSTPIRLCTAAIALVCLCFTGCRTAPAGPTADETPSYSEIAEVHNQRIERLSELYARGVIEIRWRDGDGRHFEQGNLDLWLQLPRHTALRVEKLGNVFLWLGSNDERFWLFDMLGDQTVLLTAPHDAAIDAAGLFAVRPLALVDLAGLTVLPEPHGNDDPEVHYDESLDAWLLTAPGQGGDTRLYLHRTSLLPVRVESIMANGDIAYRSDLQLTRYRTAARPGVPPSQYGRMPTLIDITAMQSPGEGITHGEIKIALGSPTGRVENQPMDRVFDLERLMRSMRPDHIESDIPADQLP